MELGMLEVPLELQEQTAAEVERAIWDLPGLDKAVQVLHQLAEVERAVTEPMPALIMEL
jgi:hypothetical protein